MIHSSAFGPFDPLKPSTIPGLFAENLVTACVEIQAPIELVWQTITGFDDYPQWNPLNRFFRLDGEAKANERVTFGPHWGPYDHSGNAELPEAGFVQRETITVWEENCCLAYGVITKAFNAERSQVISTMANGNTRYQTFERISGILSPLMKLAYRKKILTGFTANGVALKKRCEYLAKAD